MKKLSLILILSILMLHFSGCNSTQQVNVATTTRPVYDFTSALCEGTDISVGLVINESVSCLHDYTLQVSQMRMLEGADLVVISGAGLEDFMEDALSGKQIIDASEGAHLHKSGHDHHHEGHSHEQDPHIWLSPENAAQMAKNICAGLLKKYPQHAEVFSDNLDSLLYQLSQLQEYGNSTLTELSCRELITFHDGFGYFAEAFGLRILRAVEEESGSEASAAILKELIVLTESHSLPAIFTERSGSQRAAGIISKETCTPIYILDMGMSGQSYFETMYHNIDTVKEAMG